MIGAFTCPACGFAYARPGPDTTPEDRFRIGWIVEHGPVWWAAFRALVGDASISQAEACRRLGVSPRTVETCKRRLVGGPAQEGDGASRPGPRPASREEHGANVERVLAEHPGASHKVVRAKAWKSFEWLRARRRMARRGGPASSGGHPDDGGLRDAERARGIAAATDQIRARPGRPRRSTRRVLRREGGAKLPNPKRPHRSPRAVAALARALESKEEWALRCIAWAAADLERGGGTATPSRLLGVARLKRSLVEVHPRILAALEAAAGNSRAGAATAWISTNARAASESPIG